MNWCLIEIHKKKLTFFTTAYYYIRVPTAGTLDERRNRQDLIEVFKICRGYTRINPNDLFYFDNNGKGTKGHSCKLVKLGCTRDSRKYFFSNRVISRWNLLDQGAVDATSVNAFNGRLDELRDTRMGFFTD